MFSNFTDFSFHRVGKIIIFYKERIDIGKAAIFGLGRCWLDVKSSRNNKNNACFIAFIHKYRFLFLGKGQGLISNFFNLLPLIFIINFWWEHRRNLQGARRGGETTAPSIFSRNFRTTICFLWLFISFNDLKYFAPLILEIKLRLWMGIAWYNNYHNQFSN